MKRFDALDRNTPIHQSHLLEASAGTGKTFSIENIVARLIVDPHRPLLIEEILVVTFTNAATQDLRQRIWKGISSLVQQIKTLDQQEMVPDYLLQIIEEGPAAILRAKRLWEQALFNFDKAQIFTLHSFCYKMLREFLFEGGLSRDALSVETMLSKKLIRRIIQDYFMMEDAEKNRKLDLALSQMKDGEHLLDEVVKAILRQVPVLPLSDDDHLSIFVRDCQLYFSEFEKKEEASSFNSILLEMERAVGNPDFAQRVRERFRAAIIDEFQDTDPVQWSIFRTLFLSEESEKPTLYLVGDPKQSIYAFRQADIYTYLEAAQALGEENMASLDTNYRSTPRLVEALNDLFATPGLIQLPRLEKSLDIPKVKSGKEGDGIAFKDHLGAIHFFAAERKIYSKEAIDQSFYVPFIVKEIQRLILEENVSPKQCAILVKDHNQAKRVAQGLSKAGIPFHNQRSGKLTESPAFAEIRTLLQALNNPRQIGKVKLALGGQIFGWTADRLQGLQNLESLEKILVQFNHWRSVLIKEGVALAFNEIMTTVLSGETVSERLLGRQSGHKLYQDLLQTIELLASEQSQRNILADGLVAYMDELVEESDEDENELNLRQDPDADSVVITTIHSSKGLEYDIVFALGCAQRPRELKGFEMHHDGHQVVQSRIPEDNPILKKVALENSAEHMRQLYVTLTRAKYRLYIPAIFAKTKEIEKLSPIEQFLHYIGEVDSFDKLKAHLDHSSITSSLIEEDTVIIKSASDETEITLVAPPKIVVPGETLNMYSYSALTRGMSKQHGHIEHVGLPSSGDVGNFLHNLLETVPFHLNRTELEEFLKPRAEGSLYREWADEVYQMIYDALNTPLPLKTGPCPLSEIDPHKCFRETEFMFPWTNEINFPDVTPLPGYLKGVIDLVFEHDGYHYILDWKSNVLPGYETAHLQQAMEDHHYLLQAAVYREAWRRFVQSTDPIPFGSVFYIFLRGLNAGKGVYNVS